MPHARGIAPYTRADLARSIGLPVALIAALSGAPSSVRAQSADPFDLTPEQLFAATVVSATKTEDNWWDTPAAVFVLTGADIARSGATSILKRCGSCRA